MWRFLQYGKVVEDLLDSQPADCDQVEARLDILQQRGSLCRRPISARLEDGIFELRGKLTRIFFYFRPNREIVFVHSIQKKTSKVAREDIELAKARRRQIEEGKANVVTFSR